MAGALGLVALLAAGACGGDDDDASSDDAADTGATEGDGGGGATLDVTDLQFSDASAPAGGTLEVANNSGSPHTFTADDGAFDEELPDGETVSVTVPSEPGSYAFHCEIHPSMQATLTVQ